MPVLDNPRHERFCQLVFEGKASGTDAYQLAYGCDYDSAHANAYRLMADDGIKLRLDELKQQVSDINVLSRVESLQFLANVVRTPIGQIDEMHPLAQAVKRSPEGNVVEVKMPAKLDALTLNAKLQGWLTEKTEHTHRLTVFSADTEKPVIDV